MSLERHIAEMCDGLSDDEKSTNEPYLNDNAEAMRGDDKQY
jgi:hypothetical protein